MVRQLHIMHIYYAYDAFIHFDPGKGSDSGNRPATQRHRHNGFGDDWHSGKGIEILTGRGVAARTAATVGDALAILSLTAAYSPSLSDHAAGRTFQRSFIAL